jgi:FkbM family methyltransferase
MGANSRARRLIKRVLHPFIDERRYRWFQCAAMAWDIRRGTWREPELQLLPHGLRAGETAIDVGANYGLYAYHMSRVVGRGGKVIAFEPVPFTVETLRLVTQLLRLRNVEIVSKGLSDRAGRISFELPVQDSGAPAAGLAHIGGRNNDRPGKETQIRYAGSRVVECEVVRLDDVLDSRAEIPLIKCDIEGAELMAFRGAAATIDRCLPTVICEINPWYMEGFGMRVSELLQFFAERQYQLYFFDDKRRQLVPRSEANVVEDNYVFLHPRWRHRFASLLPSDAKAP